MSSPGALGARANSERFESKLRKFDEFDSRAHRSTNDTLLDFHLGTLPGCQ